MCACRRFLSIQCSELPPDSLLQFDLPDKNRPFFTHSSENKYSDKRDVHKISPVILGPEMAAPILWAPGIFCFFLLENPNAHKISPFREGVLGFLRIGGGGESANFILWAWGFFRNMLAASVATPANPRSEFRKLFCFCANFGR